jgi:threonine dehydrogenase-like Zn-dependent dehydrogenase
MKLEARFPGGREHKSGAAGSLATNKARKTHTMRALCWHGKGDVWVETVPDPKIQHPRDAIIKITACAICGSDLHLLDGYQPTMESGDILGHENMGEVIELGSEVTDLAVRDRVVVPFTISCGQCWFCQQGLYSCCDRTNPNAEMACKAMGQSPAGLFGFSYMLGGYSGGYLFYRIRQELGAEHKHANDKF